MLSKFLALFSATSVLSAIDTRYFITQFNAAGFPMGTGTCNPTSILPSGSYQMATCDSPSQLTWTIYPEGDSDCSDTPTTVTILNATTLPTQTGLGNYLDFNCDNDLDSEYTAVEFSVGTCNTQTKVIMNAAIGTCAFASDQSTDMSGETPRDSIKVMCDMNKAELFYYDGTNNTAQMFGDCTDDYLYQVRNATTTCGYMLTTGGVDVYGRLVNCTIDPVPAMPEDGANKLSIVLLAIISIIATLNM